MELLLSRLSVVILVHKSWLYQILVVLLLQLGDHLMDRRPWGYLRNLLNLVKHAAVSDGSSLTLLGATSKVLLR